MFRRASRRCGGPDDGRAIAVADGGAGRSDGRPDGRAYAVAGDGRAIAWTYAWTYARTYSGSLAAAHRRADGRTYAGPVVAADRRADGRAYAWTYAWTYAGTYGSASDLRRQSARVWQRAAGRRHELPQLSGPRPQWAQ